MAPLTIRWAIAETLEDLNKNDFDRFCFVLRDHGVSCRAVEDKTLLQVTDLMIRTFNEEGALKVAVEILRQINSHQLADTLESKTKHVDKGEPTFRRNPQGGLELNPSHEAHACRRPPLAAGGPPPKTPREVATEAKARVLAEVGGSSNDRLVLSRYTIQFGQYRDKTFKWLLENDVTYVAWVVASHQLDPQRGNSHNPRISNKDSLTEYAVAYPEVLKEVERKKAELTSQRHQPSGNSQRLKDRYMSKYKTKTRPMKKK